VKLFVNGFEFPLKLRHLDPANTVTGIQQRLANLGYDPGPIDGILGPETRAALANFQLDYGLPRTGQPDEDTIKALRSVHENVEDDQRNALDGSQPAAAGLSGDDPAGAEPQEQPDKTDEEHDLPPPDYSDEMALGSDASRPMSIACLQTMLTNLGYDPGPIDNLDGPKTRSGVKAFQADNQVGHALAIDGIAGPLTRTALRKVYNG
jgi:peptidoglycan hydrolase-like protein with peptidoglycan-binding domain